MSSVCNATYTEVLFLLLVIHFNFASVYQRLLAADSAEQENFISEGDKNTMSKISVSGQVVTMRFIFPSPSQFDLIKKN